MFCPNCGAKNLASATTCLDCGRPMPAGPGASPVASSSPAAAPAEAPRILRKAAPLAPPSLEGLPRSPTSSMASLQTAPSQPPPAATLERAPVTASRPAPLGDREVTQPFIVHPDITAPMSRSGAQPAAPSAMPSVAPLPPQRPTVMPQSSAMTTSPMIPVIPELRAPPALTLVPELPRQVSPPVAPVVAVPPAPPAPQRFAPAMPTVAQVITEPAGPLPSSPSTSSTSSTSSMSPPAPAPSVPRTPSPPVFVQPPPPPPVFVPPPPPRAPAPAPAAPRAAVVVDEAPRQPAWAAPAKTAVPAAIKPTRLEYASWWRQWGAAIIDGVGAAAFVVGFVRLSLLVQGIKPTPQGLIDALHANVLSLIPVVVALPVGIALWHLLAVLFGATLGQRVLGLKLVDSRGRRAAVPRLVIRAVVAGIGGAVFLASPLYALLLDGRRRGFGDIIARTAAIRR